MLLLAALLALSQTASAWTYYYLRSDGANYNDNTRHELKWDGSGYTLENFSVESDWTFKVIATNTPNVDNQWYGPATATTIDGNYSGNLQGKDSQQLTLKAGKAYTVTVKVEARYGNPNAITFTEVQQQLSYFKSGTNIYLDLNNTDWRNGGPSFKGTFYSADGTASSEVDFTLVEGKDQLYVCTVPEGEFTSLTINRYDSNGSSQWSKLIGVTPSENGNTVKLSGVTTDFNNTNEGKYNWSYTEDSVKDIYRLVIRYKDINGVDKTEYHNFNGTQLTVNALNLLDSFNIIHILGDNETEYVLSGEGVISAGSSMKLADATLGRANVTFSLTANDSGVPQSLSASIGTVTPFSYYINYLGHKTPFDSEKQLSINGFGTTAPFLVSVEPSFHGNVNDNTTFVLTGTNVKESGNGYCKLDYSNVGTADIAFSLAVNASGYPTAINAEISNFKEPTASKFYLTGAFNSWAGNDANYNFSYVGYELDGKDLYLKYTYEFSDFNASHIFKLYYDNNYQNPSTDLTNIECETNDDAAYKLTEAFKAAMNGNSNIRFTLLTTPAGNYHSLSAELIVEDALYAIVVNGKEVAMTKAADANTFTLRFSDERFPVGSSFQIKRIADGALFPADGEQLSGSLVKTENGALMIDTENLGITPGLYPVTFVLKVDDNGKPVGISAAVNTLQSDFYIDYNGHKVYFTGTGNRLICSAERFDLSKDFYLKQGTDTHQVTGTNVQKGTAEGSIRLRSEATDQPTVLFTLMLDNLGKPLSLSAIRISAGMPFYPDGITTRKEFRQAMERGDGPFYYLSGHNINNAIVSPEWQLIKESDTRYVCDFTYNRHDHKSSDLVSGNWGNLGPNTITVQKFVNCAATQPVLDWNAGDQSALAAAAPQAGKRWRAIYNPLAASNKLTFVALRYDAETKTWVETESTDATVLPFISLIGDEWKQKDIYSLAYQPESTSTDNAWQDAWIQYGANGQPVLSRTYGQAYYNTQWPPKNPIMFTVDVNNADFSLNSENLTFTTTGKRATGRSWMDEFDSYQGQLELEADKEYVLYQVDNVWVKGNWKIWSGWSSSHYNGGYAEWDMNWNWGHGSQSENPTSIGMNQTVELGLERGDIYLEDAEVPRFLSHIYFFLATDEAQARAQGKSHSRIFTTESLGGAQIMARSNEDYTFGLFNPSIKDLKDGVTVQSVEIVAKSVVGNKVVANLSIADVTGNVHDNDSFRAIFKKNPSSYAPGYFEGDRAYSASGWYYYEMTVKFSQGDPAVVTSNPYWIEVASENLFTAQLVEVQNNSIEGYKYVTGSDPSATVAYGVNTDESGNVTDFTRLASVPGNEFYGDREKAIWTNKMVVFSYRPWEDDNVTVENKNSKVKTWELFLNGASKDEINYEVTDTDADYARIFDIADAGAQEFNLTISYWPGTADGDVDTETVVGPISRGTTTTYLRVPNPRLQPRFSVEKWREETERAITVGDQEYTHVRPRHYSVTLYVDMPNATQELLNVIPEDEKVIDVKFTDNAWMAGYIGRSQLNLSQADVTGSGATIKFNDMPTGSWLHFDEESEQWMGVARHLAMSFPTGDNSPVRWYDRPRNGVDVQLKPIMNAPEFADNCEGMKVYRYKAPVEGKENAWKEYFVMATPPTITPASTNKLHEGNAAIKHEPEHSYYALFINDKMLERYQLIEELEDEAITYTITESAESTWYSGMDKDKWINDRLDLSISHIYFFDSTNPNLEGDGTFVIATGLSKQQRAAALAAAPALTAEGEEIPAPSFIPLMPGKVKTYDVYDNGFSHDEIATSVEEIESGRTVALAGAGFIHLLTEGAVYTVDGRCVFSGKGRADVAPGIYVIATPGASYKMVVK